MGAQNSRHNAEAQRKGDGEHGAFSQELLGGRGERGHRRRDGGTDRMRAADVGRIGEGRRRVVRRGRGGAPDLLHVRRGLAGQRARDRRRRHRGDEELRRRGGGRRPCRHAGGARGGAGGCEGGRHREAQRRRDRLPRRRHLLVQLPDARGVGLRPVRPRRDRQRVRAPRQRPLQHRSHPLVRVQLRRDDGQPGLAHPRDVGRVRLRGRPVHRADRLRQAQRCRLPRGGFGLQDVGVHGADGGHEERAARGQEAEDGHLAPGRDRGVLPRCGRGPGRGVVLRADRGALRAGRRRSRDRRHRRGRRRELREVRSVQGRHPGHGRLRRQHRHGVGAVLRMRRERRAPRRGPRRAHGHDRLRRIRS